MKNLETICAISTPPGVGGIAVVRISGDNAKTLCNNVLKNRAGEGAASFLNPNNAVFCYFYDEQQLVDEVVATYFAAPHSYTGDDVVEISCHGSMYVQQRILETLLKNGARLAEPGEFTMRAFVNGKMDLAQAEAVADLIDSHSETSHRLAIKQLRGGFSQKLSQLRQQLVNLSALLELELDFSDEDVEFADRTELRKLLDVIENEVKSLADSFVSGNAIKNGVPVAIIGRPNVGKSTLLNALLGDERAIVSDIPGTTRDTVEDTATFGGITFRFIDTAGLRHSNDTVESFGIERSYKAAENALVVLFVVDAAHIDSQTLAKDLEAFQSVVDIAGKQLIVIANKSDLASENPLLETDFETIHISAKQKLGIDMITDTLSATFRKKVDTDSVVLTNARHYDAMQKILQSLGTVRDALGNNIPGDLVMVDIRQALYYIGLVTGEVSSDEILGTIFSRFCIGK